MEITNIIATNAKQIREQKQLSLEAAAELTNVSRAMLAQIEKGTTCPTVALLWKIANGYKVSFSSLIEGNRNHTDVLRRNEIQSMVEDDGRYIDYLTVPFDDKRLFECHQVIIQTGGSLNALPHLKGAEEYLTLFSGELEVTVDSVSQVLYEGDSIRFFADVPHSYKNVGSTAVTLNLVIYYNK